MARGQVTPFRYYGSAARAAVTLLRKLTASRKRFARLGDFTNLSFVDGELQNYDFRRGYERSSRGHVTPARLIAQRARCEARKAAREAEEADAGGVIGNTYAGADG